MISHLVEVFEPESLADVVAGHAHIFENHFVQTSPQELKINYIIPTCASHVRLLMTGFSKVLTFICSFGIIDTSRHAKEWPQIPTRTSAPPVGLHWPSRRRAWCIAAGCNPSPCRGRKDGRTGHRRHWSGPPAVSFYSLIPCSCDVGMLVQRALVERWHAYQSSVHSKGGV